MRRHTVSRIIALIVGLLLVAAVIGGFLYLKKQVSTPTASEADGNQPAVSSLIGSQHNGPFLLNVTSQQIGGKSYTSFEVYFVNDASTDLLYTCGRMFPSDDIRSITWRSDGSNDIAVTLTGGKQELYSYDESGQWR